MEDAYRICPRCGAEYVPSVGRCLDCGVDLIREGEAAPLPEPETPLPAAAELRLVRATDVSWAQSLASALIEAGIPCRIEVIPPAPGEEVRGRVQGLRYGVFVQPEHGRQAAAIDAEHARTQLPDLEGHAPGAASDDGCPGCGAELAPEAVECEECGLVFAPQE